MKLKGGSLLSLVNREFGQKFRKKQDALDYISKLIEGKKGSN